jgi:SAM-dependent methyltransferase
MDGRTVQYYIENAEAVYARHRAAKAGVAKYFKLAFPPRSEIFDIGAGSGQDMGILINEDYDAYGVEPSEPLRQLVLSNAPQLAGRIYAGCLPGLSLLDRKFDGILCSAVFMHIPKEEHFDAACEIRDHLKPNGRFLLSVPRSRPDLDVEDRDRYGRLFTPTVPESLELLFERLGLQRIGKWEDDDSLGRPGHLPGRPLDSGCPDPALE